MQHFVDREENQDLIRLALYAALMRTALYLSEKNYSVSRLVYNYDHLVVELERINFTFIEIFTTGVSMQREKPTISHTRVLFGRLAEVLARRKNQSAHAMNVHVASQLEWR